MYAAECADTIPYFNIEDFPLQSREAVINNELKKINTWLQLNKLSLNTDKSKFMLIHEKKEHHQKLTF